MGLDTVNFAEDFFESKGLPYEAKNMAQLFSCIRTASTQVAVVAAVEVKGKDRYFIGYYDPIAATNKAAEIRRVRKFKVKDVARLGQGSVLDIREQMR
jgi:hypothetical protein